MRKTKVWCVCVPVLLHWSYCFADGDIYIVLGVTGNPIQLFNACSIMHTFTQILLLKYDQLLWYWVESLLVWTHNQYVWHRIITEASCCVTVSLPYPQIAVRQGAGGLIWVILVVQSSHTVLIHLSIALSWIFPWKYHFNCSNLWKQANTCCHCANSSCTSPVCITIFLMFTAYLFCFNVCKHHIKNS